MENDRKKEVINICLDLFIEKGLTSTSTRNLSSALKLQNAGLYYYFESKDEAVIACAEEAALRVESALIPGALHDIDDLDTMMKRLQSRADEMVPTMRFLVTVCASSQYKDKMKPALGRLAKRYGHYAEQVAKRLNCSKEDVEPYVYLVITAVANYMIFSEDSLATVYKGNIIKNLIMDCQSYTKYRPNETTGGIFVSWRRKEELPTGA